VRRRPPKHDAIRYSPQPLLNHHHHPYLIRPGPSLVAGTALAHYFPSYHSYTPPVVVGGEV
jgi:hypothetical protein